MLDNRLLWRSVVSTMRQKMKGQNCATTQSTLNLIAPTCQSVLVRPVLINTNEPGRGVRYPSVS